MQRRLVIDVPELTFNRLTELAEQQRRDPKSQAVVLLERALRRVPAPDRAEQAGRPQLLAVVSQGQAGA